MSCCGKWDPGDESGCCLVTVSQKPEEELLFRCDYSHLHRRGASGFTQVLSMRDLRTGAYSGSREEEQVLGLDLDSPPAGTSLASTVQVTFTVRR
jgi:hypothetical protein